MARLGRKAEEIEARKRRRTRLAAAGILIVLGLAVILLLLARPGPPPDLEADEDPVLGRADAPVTVFYFADFQCPHCREFEAGNMVRLTEEYVETGEVRLVFKDFPVVGEDSWRAAQASQFVWESTPDVYWEWHRGLFMAQGPSPGWASEDFLLEYSAQYPAIDTDALREALREDAFREEVEEDRQAGLAHGVQGTPTVIVAGETVNPLDYPALQRAIEDALAAQEA